MLRAFQIEKQTTAPTSLHVYLMVSDSCTVFLHLYKSIFLLLPSRSSEQCSLWLLGSIKVCQMNRKNHAWRGNEKLSKGAWNLKHFFSAIFCFFSFVEWRLDWTSSKVSLTGCTMPFVACLSCFLIRWERSTGQSSKVWTQFRNWKEFGIGFVVQEVWNQWNVHGGVTKSPTVVQNIFFL